MTDSDGDSCWGCGILLIGYVVLRIIIENIEAIVWISIIAVILGIFYYLAKNIDSKKRKIDTSQPSITDSSDSDKQTAYRDMMVKLAEKKDELKNKMKSDDDGDDDDNLNEKAGATESHSDALNQLVVEVISDDNDEPIKDCIVKVKSDGVAFEKISDIDGKTIFPKLGVANYKINITAEGFQKDEQDVQLNEMKKLVVKLNRSATLKIIVSDAALKTIIKDATIKIDSDVHNTSENGSVLIKDLICGDKITLDINKDQYFDHNVEHTVESNEDELTIELKSNIELDDKYIDFRNELEDGITKSFNKLPTSIDFLLPNYYKEIFMSLINVTESIATNPVYRHFPDYDEKIDQLHKTVRSVYVEIDAMFTNSDLINAFIETSIHDGAELPNININNDSYNSYIKLYMTEPNNIINDYKSKIEDELYAVDRIITEKLDIYNISPVASLWTVSKKFVVTHADNDLENSACLLFGKMLVDSTEKMFEIEEITKRLQQQND